MLYTDPLEKDLCFSFWIPGRKAETTAETVKRVVSEHGAKIAPTEIKDLSGLFQHLPLGPSTGSAQLFHKYLLSE